MENTDYHRKNIYKNIYFYFQKRYRLCTLYLKSKLPSLLVSHPTFYKKSFANNCQDKNSCGYIQYKLNMKLNYLMYE